MLSCEICEIFKNLLTDTNLYDYVTVGKKDSSSEIFASILNG